VCEETHPIVIKSMGADNNQHWEGCKSRKHGRRMKNSYGEEEEFMHGDFGQQKSYEC
jgi:hypothetical protein